MSEPVEIVDESQAKIHRAYLSRESMSSGASPRARAYRFAKSTWPLWVLLPVAAFTNWILTYAFGDPWPPSEIAATVVFGLLLTAATMVIGQRQGSLQRALADATMVSATSSIRGSLETLNSDFDAGVVQAVITESRSGLPLLKYSKPTEGSEFLRVVLDACEQIDQDFSRTLRAHSSWRKEDWTNVVSCAASLRNALEALREYLGREEIVLFNSIKEVLGRIERRSNGYETVPFENFRSAFFRGDVQERIRAMLDWETLEQELENDVAELAMVREWSVNWLRDNKVLTVWHALPSGEYCDFYQDGAAPIPLGEISSRFESLPSDTRATINLIGRTFNFRTSRRGLHIAEIVTLQLEDESLLILDGNHRMSAVVRGPDSHRGPLGVQIVEYRITSKSTIPKVPEQLEKVEKEEFHKVLLGVLESEPGATPRDVWEAWRKRGDR